MQSPVFGEGTGLSLTDASSVVVAGSRFSGFAFGLCTVEDSGFFDNSDSGVDAVGGVVASRFHHNDEDPSWFGAGIISESGALTVPRDVIFSGNRRGVLVFEASASLRDASFVDHVEHAIEMDFGTVTLTNSSFEQRVHAAIQAKQSIVTVLQSSFYDRGDAGDEPYAFAGDGAFRVTNTALWSDAVRPEFGSDSILLPPRPTSGMARRPREWRSTHFHTPPTWNHAPIALMTSMRKVRECTASPSG